MTVGDLQPPQHLRQQTEQKTWHTPELVELDLRATETGIGPFITDATTINAS